MLHRRLRCLCFTLVTIALGLLWREAPLHLPWFAYKYGGSALWAAMVYGLLALLLPRWRPLRVALLACVLTALVELSRPHHTPAEDAFRLTLAGRLLLGRVFAPANIVAYWLAIALTAALDALTARSEPPPASPRP